MKLMGEFPQGLQNDKNISGGDSKTCQRTVPCQYFAPQKIEEALEILARYGKEIKIIAGGTDLLIQYYDRLYEISNWLDLKNLKELKVIEVNKNHMIIGAMVNHAQLEKSEDIKKHFPILSQAAADIGSPQIRNRGTIGGNIVNASPAGDLLAPLIAYGAQFKLQSNQGEKIVPAEEFFIGPKKTILEPAQLLTRIILPLPSEKTYGCWIKIGKRKALIIATITLALVVEMAEDNKTVKDVRTCLGSVAPTPIEIKKIRKKMVEKNFNQLDFTELGQIVEDKISPIDDIRGTREYRKDVAKNIMINALKEIISQLEGDYK
jgi:CO/xanthine dehydrogenase FAD-binding subunit